VHVRRSVVRFAILFPLACSSAEPGSSISADTPMASGEAVIAVDTSAVNGLARESRDPRLSPAADSIARQLTFVARNTTVLTAATRGGRWVVDIGRVDANVTPERLAAYREAVAALSPVARGDTLHVYGPWGATRTVVDGFDVWSGRMVATIDLPPQADSLALENDRRAKAPRGSDVPYGAAAYRFPLARDTAGTARCEHQDLTPELSARVGSVRDSLRTLLLADTVSAPPRYRLAPRVIDSRLTGCFGEAKVLVLVALRSGYDLLTREQAVLIQHDGSVIPVPVQDYRFRAHLMLHTVDADGDGVDDVVARGYGRRVGSLVILRLDPQARTLTRLTGGFAYEG
jgi:hypothetical protein